jgi:hypothetical protein
MLICRSSEDETANLRRELERIKKEREDEARQKVNFSQPSVGTPSQQKGDGKGVPST